LTTPAMWLNNSPLGSIIFASFLNPANSSVVAPSATSALITNLALSFLHLLEQAFLCICSYRVIYASCDAACSSMTTLPLSCKAAFSLAADNESCITASSYFYQITVLPALFSSPHFSPGSREQAQDSCLRAPFWSEKRSHSDGLSEEQAYGREDQPEP